MNDRERFYMFISGILAGLGLRQRGPLPGRLFCIIDLEDVRRLLGWKRKTIQQVINYYEEKRPDHIFDFSTSPRHRFYHIKHDGGYGVSLVTIKMVPSDYVRWRMKARVRLKLLEKPE